MPIVWKSWIAQIILVIDPHYQEEIGLLLHSGGRGKPWESLSAFLCYVIKVNGKLKQVNSCKTTNGPETSGINV